MMAQVSASPITASTAPNEPETRAAFVDAIAEVPPDADPIFTMTVTDDLLLRARPFDSALDGE